MKKKLYFANIITLFLFLINCNSQEKKNINNNNNNNLNTLNNIKMKEYEPLLDFLYKNHNSIDFGMNYEELIRWDLENNVVLKLFKEKYKNDSRLIEKINSLNKIKEDFFIFANKSIKDDFKTYKYIDGPFFEYLVKKKSSVARDLIIKIMLDTSISKSQKEEMTKNLYVWNVKCIINDSDGYTNLRKSNSTNSEIIEKINSGESVHVLNNTENWWYVKFNNNNGYIHISKINLILE
jgi:hypothetical protein